MITLFGFLPFLIYMLLVLIIGGFLADNFIWFGRW